jgi:hypothetical protein
MAGTNVEFHFKTQEQPALPVRLWRGTAKQLRRLVGAEDRFPELKRGYTVSFRSSSTENHGRPSWGADETTTHLEGLLAKMLEAALSRDQVSQMANQLHAFLFANGELDVVFDRALRGPNENPSQREIEIFADDPTSLPLLANLPWEIARDTIPKEQVDERLLLGTLASRPIVRAITLPTSSVVVEARVRVLCCIANYEGDVPQFDALAFDQAIKESLNSQPVSLDFVLAANYLPTAAQTFAEIARVDPHIFIFVGHGKSHSGIPQLRFEEWINVEEFAKHLTQTGQALLAIFIACDQSRLIEAPAAQSGALTLLNHGVPAVVAMQGYVDPKRAQAFLDTFIKNLFITHSISQAAAQGRVAMDKTLRSGPWSSDWVLPVVFRRGGQELEREQLSLILGHYQPALERLLSFVPAVIINLLRPTLERSLLDFLNEAVGLMQITGGIGSGRTQLIRVVVRTRIKEAIDNRSPLPRPIFYVDLDESDENLTSEAWFLSKLQSRFGDVRSLLASSTLTTVMSTTLSSAERVGVLLAELDKSRAVIIIDHLRTDTTGFWAELMRRAVGLQNSLVIVVGPPDELAPDPVKELQVLPFDLEETKAYVKQFVKDDMSLAVRWHEDSGGTPLLLDGLRAFDKSSVLKAPRDIALRKEGTIAARYIELIREALEPEEFAALSIFSWFPGLIETGLAYRFVPGNDTFATLNSLVEKGVLSKIEKSGKEWLSLARLKADGLDEQSTTDAASELTGRFADEVLLTDDSQKELDDLAIQPGGTSLLRGVQSAYLALGDHKMALSLAILLTSALRDQPFELYRFFIAVLDPKPVIEVLHSVWVQAAGLARRLGELDLADSFLSEVKDKEMTQYLRASVFNTKATIMKDRGESDKTEEILELCDQGITIAQAGVDGILRAEEVAPEEWRRLLSSILYNRAAVLQFFARRESDALSDIRQVQDLEKDADQVLAAAAMCQEVDIRLSQAELIDNWDNLLDLVRRAYVVLGRVQSAHGFAYCCYQYARYYRKRPGKTDDDCSQNLRTAARFYEEAARAASDVGDFKRRAAAVQHWVRVSWADLHSLSEVEAAAYLDELLTTLGEYRGDAYAARLLRDTLFLRAEIEIAAKGARSRELLRAASDASTTYPLNPGRKGEDRRRGMAIFVRYLEILRAEDDGPEAEAFLVDHHDLLNTWLEETHVDQPWETLTKLKEKEQLWET